MDYKLQTNEQIVKTLAKRIDELRIQKKLTEPEVAKKGGTSVDAIHRLKNGKNIGIYNLLGILRGIDELPLLDSLVKKPILSGYSPASVIKKSEKKQKRVRKPKEPEIKDEFKWGDE
jgi:transcriptional regulator with XRE-family HTH domain